MTATADPTVRVRLAGLRAIPLERHDPEWVAALAELDRLDSRPVVDDAARRRYRARLERLLAFYYDARPFVPDPETAA